MERGYLGYGVALGDDMDRLDVIVGGHRAFDGDPDGHQWALVGQFRHLDGDATLLGFGDACQFLEFLLGVARRGLGGAGFRARQGQGQQTGSGGAQDLPPAQSIWNGWFSMSHFSHLRKGGRTGHFLRPYSRMRSARWPTTPTRVRTTTIHPIWDSQA